MINETLIQIYYNRFVTRPDAYDVQKVNPYRYDAVYEPVTLELIARHLAGEITLGFPAVDTEGNSKWAAWDSDTDTDYLTKIEAVLKALGLHPACEGRRPGKEGHLWLFFDKPLLAADLMKFAEEIRAHAQVPKLEFFPKQAKANKCANPVRGPLGIHRKPGAGNERGWFEGTERNIVAQLEWLGQQPLNPSQVVRNIVKKLESVDKFKVIPIRRHCFMELDLEEIFADLNPKCNDGYCECVCPSCGERRAYFYLDGHILKCNRIDSCAFEITTHEWMKRGKTGKSWTG